MSVLVTWLQVRRFVQRLMEACALAVFLAGVLGLLLIVAASADKL